jgi:hypothetical protein
MADARFRDLPGESGQDKGHGRVQSEPAPKTTAAQVADSGIFEMAGHAPQEPQRWKRIFKILFTLIFTVLAGALGILSYFNVGPSEVSALLSTPGHFFHNRPQCGNIWRLLVLEALGQVR